jgi:ABC-type sugar transport system ATPase subunit
MNFVPATRVDGGVTAPLAQGVLKLDPNSGRGSKDLKIGIRPEHVRVFRDARPGAVPGQVKDINVGIAGRYVIRVALEGFEIKAKADDLSGINRGDTVYVAAEADWISVFADGQRLGVVRAV